MVESGEQFNNFNYILRKINRCKWCESHPLYIEYHDKEWGKPLYDDKKIFEFLLLETFQAGLSWITILKKRENFKIAFDNFDYKKISKYNEGKIKKLENNANIIRNKLKIKAAKNNASKYIKIQKEYGSFSKYIWQFVDNNPIVNKYTSVNKIPKKTFLSEKISENLKKRGFQFVGPTIIYAFMQAIGIVNDHTTDCFRHKEV